MQASKQQQPQSRQPETENERLRRKVKEFQEREAARSIAQQKSQREREEQERLYQVQKTNAERALHNKRSTVNQAEQIILKQKQDAEQARLAQVETAKALEEQKKKDLERLQRELDAATLASPPLPVKSPKFGFFSRKASSLKDTPPTTATAIDVPVPKIMEGRKKSQQNISSRSPQKKVEPIPSQAPKKVVEVPQQIHQGGGGIVPQTDAPISASNAGERVSQLLYG
jgi:hypothetical protein